MDVDSRTIRRLLSYEPKQDKLCATSQIVHFSPMILDLHFITTKGFLKQSRICKWSSTFNPTLCMCENYNRTNIGSEFMSFSFKWIPQF